jgi:Na+/H+ antiporter NhaC
MFGDNLSMISDTTIAATRTQGVEMKDKFRVNGLIAAPAALITVVLLAIFGAPETAVAPEVLEFSIIKVVPYILVLVLAIVGLNVFVTLAVGIFSAGIIGLVGGELTILTFAQNIYSGFTGMFEVFCLSLFMGGLSYMVTKQGGLEWLLSKIQTFIKGKTSAQFGIAALTAAADLATANNTVSIIIVGPIAKGIAAEYKVDPRKTASILDITSCIFQGAIPYGAQILVAGSLAAAAGYSVGPMDIIPLLWYQGLLVVTMIVSFFVPYADGCMKKDPWDWEHDCASSKVAAK